MHALAQERLRKWFYPALCCLMLAACANKPVSPDARAHLSRTEQGKATSKIPDIVRQFPALPPWRESKREERYSVTVNRLPAAELLFALATEAGANLDIHGEINQEITLNASQQTFAQLMRRIARQGNLRIESSSDSISVMPDSPMLRQYKVDYVNMARNVVAAVSTQTQISNSPSTTNAPAGNGSISNTRIDNQTRNNFWESLERNIKEILREQDQALPEGSSETLIEQNSSLNTQGSPSLITQGKGNRHTTSPLQSLPTSSQSSGKTSVQKRTYREGGTVIVNPESGMVTVRATAQQHEHISAFIRRIAQISRYQVMIEATIVEVNLSDAYRQGIDWSRLRADGSGFSITRPGNGLSSDSAGGTFSLKLNKMTAPLNLVAAVDLLQSFGHTRVLSSPRLSVMNNQTALLKVVENIIYFNVKSDTTSSANVGTTTAVTTSPQSVSVGLVLAVTPQISDGGEVIVNVRPSISSVSGWKQDPNPSNSVPNLVPQIRTREIESVMRIQSGDIAVLGGLMEDASDILRAQIPLVGQIPLAGELATQRDQRGRKSELVVFLRPVVIQESNIQGDFAALAEHQPGFDFFDTAPRTDYGKSREKTVP